MLDSMQWHGGTTASSMFTSEDTLLHLLRKAATLTPTKGVMLCDETVFISYAELWRKGHAFACGLRLKGVQRGTPLMVAVDDTPAFLIALWGGIIAGNVVAPVPPAQLGHKDNASLKRLASIWATLEHQQPRFGKPTLLCGTAEQARLLQETIPTSTPLLIAGLLEYGIHQDADCFASPEDLAIMQFSSGSTGEPKGVLLTHGRIAFNLNMLKQAFGFTETTRLLSWFPYYHDFGLFGSHLLPMATGVGEWRLAPESFSRSPSGYLSLLEEHRITHSYLTPSGATLLLRALDRRAKHDTRPHLAAFERLVLGAEMLPPATCEALQNHLAQCGSKPEVVAPAYGMAEACLGVSIHKSTQGRATSWTVYRQPLLDTGEVIVVSDPQAAASDTLCLSGAGTPMPHMQWRIVDAEGLPLPPMRLGQLQLQAPCLTEGYCTRHAPAAPLWRDGWLQTGDMGFLTPDNVFVPVGRNKDLIVANGRNLYPYDLEEMAKITAGSSLRTVIAAGSLDPLTSRDATLLFLVFANNAGSANAALKREQQRIAATVRDMLNRECGLAVDHIFTLQPRDIPFTSSGKVMRHELARRFMLGLYQEKELDMSDPMIILPQASESQPTDHQLREAIQTAWQTVLEDPTITPDADTSFFAFGADSMRSAQLAALLESTTGHKLPANFAYRYPTFEAQLQTLGMATTITRPQADLEVLVRDILADVVGQDADSLCVETPLMQLAPSMDVLVRFAEELRTVFGANEHVDAALTAGSIRAMARRLEALAPKADDAIPLMPFQETLYFHSRGGIRNEPTGLSCYIMIRLSIEGQLHAPLLEQALNDLLKQHPIMRSRLDDTALTPCLRVVDDMPPVRIPEDDVTTLSPEAIAERVHAVESELLDLRWDMQAPPMFTVRLIKTASNKWELFFHADHMIIDGYSTVVLFKDLFALYDARIDGKEPPCVYELHPFAWHSWLASCRERTSRYKRDMEWHLEDFTPPPPRSAMPMKRNPAMVENVTFSTYHHPTYPDLLQGLREVSSNDPTLSVNSILLAGLFKLVNVWTAENDLVINLPLLNREQFLPTSRDVIGSFIDLIPIRLRTSFSEPVLSMAQRLERIVREKLERPVSSIGLSREIARRSGLHGSISSIIFSNSLSLLRPEDLTYSQCHVCDMPAVHTGAPGTSIDVLFHSSGGEWRIVWNYMRDLFDESFIATLAQQYDAMLRDAVDAWRSGQAKRTFTSKAALPPAHARLLESVNATDRPVRTQPLHLFMQEHAARDPQALALTFQERSLTYGEFDALTAQLASLFVQCGVGRGEFVALALPRGLDLLTAQFAAFKAGAAYVPIDPNYPGGRIAYMIDDSQAKVLVITPQAMQNLAHEELTNVRFILLLDEKNVSIIDNEIQTHIKQAGHTLLLRQNILEQDPTFTLQGDAVPSVTDPAYMIYTSGSTGNPKGVIVSHANFCNFIDYVLRTFARGTEERFALVTSHSFDMTLTSNLGSLISGASLHILSEEDTRDVERLLAFLEEQRITLLNITPSHFGMLTAVLPLMDRIPTLFPKLRVLLGGEVVNPADVTQWVTTYPEHLVVNEYGPTEASVAVSFFPIPTTNGVCELDIIPIGKPLQNTRYYILNEEMQPCMLGVPGRLFIGGHNVAQGYWRQPEKTAQAFVPDVFARAEKNAEGNADAMMYDTGDMARWLEDGNVQFLGRNDRQINLRGFRIELGEIENFMLGIAGVTGASVVVQSDHGNEKHLAAFYTLHTDATTSSEDVRTALEALLPEYMVPRFYKQLDAMPLTPSGKLDIKQLPYIVTSERPAGNTDFVAPTTATEHKLAAIWAEVFNLDAVGIDDDFWSLGGNSIRATRLLVSMHEAGLHLGLRDLFSSPTIRGLASHLEEDQAPNTETAAASSEHAGWVPLKTSSDAETTMLCLPYAGGSPAMFAELAAKLPLNIRVYSALYPGIESGKPCSAIRLLARDLKRRLPVKGQLILFGYCFGAYVAHALSTLLQEEADIDLKSVILIGATPPGAQKLAYDPQTWSKSYESEQGQAYLERIYEPLLKHLSDHERTRYWENYKAAVSGLASYTFENKTLEVPCHVLTGEQEEYPFLLEYAHTWEQQFTPCQQHKLAGGHMLVQTHLEDLIATLIPLLGKAS